MQVIETALEGVLIIEPQVFTDARGYFFESFSQEWFQREVADVCFVQDNESLSSRGVIRGLHFQLPPSAQAKLVRVVRGEVMDVAVDIRRGSPTFGQYVAVHLSGENHRQFYIPAGYAHGFVALRDDTVLNYKCSAYYAPECEGSVNYADPQLAIEWGIDTAEHIVSPKDARAPMLSEL